MVEGRKRAVIENVKPEINSGAFPIKRVIREKVLVEADILRSETDREEVFLLAMSKEVNEVMERYADRQFATFYEKELPVFVDRKKALFSSWYKIFPRSCTSRLHIIFNIMNRITIILCFTERLPKIYRI